MNRMYTNSRNWLAAAALGISALMSTGCQTTVGGQILPSAYYLRDDVQYFPAGPEQPLSNQIRVLEQYKLDRQAGVAGLLDEQP